MRDLFDVGFAVGQSVRTPDEACRLAMKDATICTSLVESRLLAGSEPLYEKFLRRFQRDSRRHWRRLLKAIERSRAEERSQFGETVYLLEPNVKRSPGGAARHSTAALDRLRPLRRGGPRRLADERRDLKDDQRALRRASEFLLRVRNELHFHAGKSHDVLDRAEQVRAGRQCFGYQGSEGLLPVEQFMREYFRHTAA